MLPAVIVKWQNMVPSFFQMCLTMFQVSVIASVIFYEFAICALIGSSVTLSIIANRIVAPTYKLVSATVRIMIYQIQIVYPGRGGGRRIQGMLGFLCPGFGVRMEFHVCDLGWVNFKNFL